MPSSLAPSLLRTLPRFWTNFTGIAPVRLRRRAPVVPRDPQKLHPNKTPWRAAPNPWSCRPQRRPMLEELEPPGRWIPPLRRPRQTPAPSRDMSSCPETMTETSRCSTSFPSRSTVPYPRRHSLTNKVHQIFLSWFAIPPVFVIIFGLCFGNTVNCSP